ncbi:MAG: hypothetical protein WC337_01310 [Candidatus Muiribacteriota bacterium]|jgi:hypothetical protein
MNNKFIKHLLILTILSFLIIPTLTVRNKIKNNRDYKLKNQFIASYLLFDLFEKATHSKNLSSQTDIKWNSDYFSIFKGEISLLGSDNYLRQLKFSVRWPKTPGNLMEFDSYSINTEIFTYDNFMDYLYE